MVPLVCVLLFISLLGFLNFARMTLFWVLTIVFKQLGIWSSICVLDTLRGPGDGALITMRLSKSRMDQFLASHVRCWLFHKILTVLLNLQKSKSM